MNSLNFVRSKKDERKSAAHPKQHLTSRVTRRVQVLVTPQQAKQWLERNKRNRPLSENLVIAYGLDMLEGRWQYNGDAIRFDSNGELIDGQHRLHACIEAGVPFETDLSFGLAPAAMRTIDIGRTRTAGHIAHLDGTQNAACACAIASLVILHQRHGIRHLNDPRCQPTKTQIVEAAGQLAALDVAVAKAKLLGRKIAAPRIIGFCYYVFAEQNRQLADRFFQELADGLGLSRTNPVYQLRERMLTNRNSKGKLPQLDILALFFKTWIAYRDNRPLRRLFWKTDGPAPERFPEIGRTV